DPVTSNCASTTVSSEPITGTYKCEQRRRTARRIRSQQGRERYECGICAGVFRSEQAANWHRQNYHAESERNEYRIYDDPDAA
ncbi:MAG: hypothetical protein WA867_04480, partial [Candidatus Acidiferrales bacterium]